MSAARKQRFSRCVSAYNALPHDGENINPSDAWAAFKGLLGNCEAEEMTEGIRRVFARPDIEIIRRYPHTLLREAARSIMREIRRTLPPRVAPMVPQPQPHPPIDAAARIVIPVVRRPIVVNAEAAALREAVFAAASSARYYRNPIFEVMMAEIKAHGKILSKDTSGLMAHQVAKLFKAIENWMECPICMEGCIDAEPWSYECPCKACPKCVCNFATENLRCKTFPVKCPGRCGGNVDPGRIMAAAALIKRDKDESIIRFCALQLASIVRMDPSTCYETHACPQCRTIVQGRVSADSPMARCTNPACAVRFCSQCKIPWADQHRCAENMEVDSKSLEEIEGTTKQCPRCQRRTEHYRNHHCHHITCLCGHQYCYECLNPWADHGVGRSKENCPVFCSEKCHCVPCRVCRPGAPCTLCGSHGCDSCRVK